MGVPSFEKCPSGLGQRWSGVWRQARDEMKQFGTFSPSMRPLLDEYVFALRGAEEARVGFGWLEHLQETVASEEIDWIVLGKIAGGLPTQWDRHAKRAKELAETLGLTPRSQKQLARKTEESNGRQQGETKDPYAALDNVEPIRRRRPA